MHFSSRLTFDFVSGLVFIVALHGFSALKVLTILYINYCIAFGLGLAATVEVKVNRNGTDIERGFRGALYLGIGLAGLGIVCAFSLLVIDIRQRRKSNDNRIEQQRR